MKANKHKNPWTTLSEKLCYESPWIQVYHHEVINPSGNEGIYGYVHFKNYATGVVPLDENNNTWLVGQYRYPNKEYTWEIPEGGGPMDKTPLESAKRELKEECGITAQKWDLISELRLSNSVSDEMAFIYTARELSFDESDPDDTEELTVKKVSFDEAYEMVMDGRITDSMSVVGILKVKLLLDEK